MTRRFRSAQLTAERVGILINGLELTLNPQHPALSQVALVRDKLINVELFKHLSRG